LALSKNKIIFMLTFFMAACGPSGTTEVVLPSTPTPEPRIDPTPAVQPITYDFGGKSFYTQIYHDDFESGDLLPGFNFGTYSDSSITNDPSQVVDGNYSVRLSQFGHLTTNPNKIRFESNTTYLIQFDYKILDQGSGNELLYGVFYPENADPENMARWLYASDLLYNTAEEGSVTFGALTGDESSYVFRISSDENSSVVIDNIQVIRQDPRWTDQQPEYWANLESLPFPRLGNYALGSIRGMVYGMAGEPFYYSATTIESRLAMFDILAGFEVSNQTMDPGLTYRLRSLNPDILILPYTIAHEHGMRDPEYDNATIDLYQKFQTGLANEWIVKDSLGNEIYDHDFPDPSYTIYQLNTSGFSPVVNGQTFQQYQVDWVVNDILKSGYWDGIFFDNLFARINPHIPNRWDPALLDFDYNANGVRDETAAAISEMTRRAAVKLLEKMRDEVGDSEIIIGNIWAFPEIYMAQYVNGYIFECVEDGWDNEWTPGLSEPAWRLILEEYFYMQAESRSPVTNILQGCGNHQEMEPSEQDLRSHRLTMGTALLSDGFYVYDLYGNTSSPFWFDEYTVNENGVAEESPENKGYLGQALGDAVELTSPATILWEEDFESGAALEEYWNVFDPDVRISQIQEDVISGGSSLVIDNPDHTQSAYITVSTKPNLVPFASDQTYVIEFDWRILETLDIQAEAYVGNFVVDVPWYQIPGVVAGDEGTAVFPTTVGLGGDHSFTLALRGSGKIAFDNIRITQGGAGPWRRDFENGFVLVNPLNKPYTFAGEELVGPFDRTGIKRISGNQAPDMNNGQPVVGPFTLQPFDAIILLADSVPLK
jgi:hypothetical protein